MSQSLIDAAKAPIIAYNQKDWETVRAAVSPGFVYDEVGTGRRVAGIEQVLEMWKGWAAAIPDSRATFHRTFVSGNTVVVEVTWTGRHTGPLQTAGGTMAPTGRPIELRACQVTEVEGSKATVMRHYFDMTTLLQQLGASAAAAGA